MENSNNFSIQNLVLGTHTSGQEDNYLIIAKIRLPIIENLLDMKAG